MQATTTRKRDMEPPGPAPRGRQFRPALRVGTRDRTAIGESSPATAVKHGGGPGSRHPADGQVLQPHDAHSCGSAPVSHRLPPPHHRDRPDDETARTIRGCARPRSTRHPRGMQSPRPTTPRWHSAAWLGWAIAAGITVQQAQSPVYVGLVVGIAWLMVEVHAPEGPFRRAFPVLVLIGVMFAVIRVVIAALTTHNGIDVLVTLPHFTMPQLLGGFAVGGTV